MKPLNVAFVWHMHQPYYKDDLTNTYLLPWVRLRAAKDYYKMPALLDGYPNVRATFNLVPSLLAQIEDYGKGESVDLFLNLSQRVAGDLSGEERDFVLRWMRESPGHCGSSSHRATWSSLRVLWMPSSRWPTSAICRCGS